MKKYLLLLLSVLTVSMLLAQKAEQTTSRALLQSFEDNVEWYEPFQNADFEGWFSLDLDGFPTNGGPFQNFPGKGDPMGFMVYTPSETNPPNVLDGYVPRPGKQYFASISSNSGAVNDWLISKELADHPGGKFSFWAKSAADYFGDDEFKVGYSMGGYDPEDFILFNNGNVINPTTNWAKYEYTIPAGAKHLAINCVSWTVMFLVDDLKFEHTVAGTAPNAVTGLQVTPVIESEITVNFSWVNPQVDSEGNSLGNLTGVKIYRGTHPMNLVEIDDVQGAAGATMTYVDVLASSDFYTYRFVPYNSAGNGVTYTTPMNFYGFETIPGAPRNIVFSRDEQMRTVITWDPVTYGSMGGSLESPVTGYSLTRTLGSEVETLATMQPGTTFTEPVKPSLNLYTYTIWAHIGEDQTGDEAIVPAYSGLSEDQVSVTSGSKLTEQPFELSRSSIISQSIYTAEQMGESGLITSISYFGNLGVTSTAHYKIYMSLTDRDVFGTTLSNAVWEYFGNQKLVFDGDIEFPAGRKDITIEFDQPFYYDNSNNQNVIITIVKPLLSSVPTVNPRQFNNTEVEGMRTYYAIGYSVDLSQVTSQPASWSTEEVPSIPSVVTAKRSDFGSISGTITNADSGLPMEGVMITLVPGENAYQQEVVYSNAAGLYEMPALLPGKYEAIFTKDGYNTHEETFVIGSNDVIVFDLTMNNAISIQITGLVTDLGLAPLPGATLTLSGFSNFTATTNEDGQFVLDAFAEKVYHLEVFHPLYNSTSADFTSESGDHAVGPFALALTPHKPGNVMGENVEGAGIVSWRAPVGTYNEKPLGWGSFLAPGDSWGAGGEEFTSGVRFEPSDLAMKLTEGAELTHVKVNIDAWADIIVEIYEGANASTLLHSQPYSVDEPGWHIIELTKSLPIDFTKEFWIGIHFLPGQYGSYPMGLDDGPNVAGRKGSMLYQNGVWTPMSLTNKNWNIYGITSHAMTANPSGYKVFRSLAQEADWTELTPTAITGTEYTDATLSSAAPGFYQYGVTAIYNESQVSEMAVSNEVANQMFFNLTLNISADAGNAEGAFVSVWNDGGYAEATVQTGQSTIVFANLLRGNYQARVEKTNYKVAELSNIQVESTTSEDVLLQLLIVAPSNLRAAQEEGSDSYRLDWTLHGTFTDQMERYVDFEKENIGDYILKDLDGFATHTYVNFTWPGAGSPMSFMVFNPFATTPAISTTSYSGRRFLTAMASPYGKNNDWLIVPAGPGELSFMAASLSSSGLEKIRVLYSTTGSEVSNFSVIENQIIVPVEWTPYTFNLPEGTTYAAINYVSDDTYFLKLDNLTYEKPYNHAISYNVYLDGQLVGAEVEGNSFVLGNLTDGNHTAAVEAVFETGVSQKIEIDILSVGVEDVVIAQLAVYPNPSQGYFNISSNENLTRVRLIDIKGSVVYDQSAFGNNAQIHHALKSGFYLVVIDTEKGSYVRKLMVNF